MKRREFIALVGGAVARPLEVRAQQAKLPVIGYLSASSRAGRAHLVTAFREGVRESGHVEGQNVAIEYRWAEDQYERLPDLAAELVRRQVEVIAATDTLSAKAAKQATTTLPIVFASGGDPIKEGLVASLNRPGSNITGLTFMSSELGAKQLGLLHELLPEARRIAVLVDPNWPITEPFVSDVRAAASATSKELQVLYVSTGNDIHTVFTNFAQKPVDALLVGPSALNNNRRAQLATLAAYYRLAAIYSFRESAEARWPDELRNEHHDAHRRVGVYAGRILKNSSS
jgi:putative tryptophan/tyrosine transport system substrate-binding protein